jgi:hypothetical protein
LIRLQVENGLSLVALQENKFRVLEYATRKFTDGPAFLKRGTATSGAVSEDGRRIAFGFCPDAGISHPTPFRAECPGGVEYLGIVNADGSNFRGYSHLASPSGFCWAPDKSRLALSVQDRKENPNAEAALRILDLRTGDTQLIVAEDDAHLTSQCWSSDGRRIVYSSIRPGMATVHVYDLERQEAAGLPGRRTGVYPTWSSNGEWIGVLDEINPETYPESLYYLVRPSKGEVRILVRGGSLSWATDVVCRLPLCCIRRLCRRVRREAAMGAKA